MSHSIIYSQNEKSEFRKNLFIGDYTFLIVNNEVDFFTGSVTVTDRQTNKELFKADSFYTRYNSDTLIDLDKNGNNELIIDIGTGATMYDYNMFLIFDFNNVSEPFSIHNAYLITNTDDIPKIVSNVRLSPGFLGTEYSYPMKYDHGQMLVETDPIESKVLAGLDINETDILDMIAEYEKETKACSENSRVQVYYEAFIMQKKILGQEKSGWRFFDKYYKCSDKKKIKEDLKNNVNENIKYLSNPSNYLFKINKN